MEILETSGSIKLQSATESAGQIVPTRTMHPQQKADIIRPNVGKLIA